MPQHSHAMNLFFFFFPVVGQPESLSHTSFSVRPHLPGQSSDEAPTGELRRFKSEELGVHSVTWGRAIRKYGPADSEDTAEMQQLDHY